MKPSLTEDELARMRRAVGNLRAHVGGPVPHGDILALGASLGPNARVTLDLTATEAIGVPMLVVRPIPPPSRALDVLTLREREVLDLIATGLTNKAIALRLSLSPATVKDHIHHILQKTGLPNRASVVALLSSSSEEF